jgi:geranylgeranyl diphosphate synthase type II
MGLSESDARRVRELLAGRAAAVDAELERLLSADPDGPAAGFHESVREAVLYSVRAGGKRLRPGLVLLAAEACGARFPEAVPPAALTAAAAVEMIHTYSLIHDDLPAMDDDDLRRGKPTNHKVFGEAMAILAGDALLNHAFTVLADGVEDPRAAVEMIRILGHAAGADGMIGGQAADILSERGQWKGPGTGFAGKSEGRMMNEESARAGDSSFRTLTSALPLLEAIHVHKTAALIRASVLMGAAAMRAGPERRDALGRYGRALGLAFQVVDDVIDETSSTAELGKTAGKDRASGKLTYPGLVGLEEARRTAERLTNEAVRSLSVFGEAGRDLSLLAEYNLFRTS